MDFFQHQDEARKSSNRLVVLFALAVLGIVLSVYFSISALFYWGQASARPRGLRLNFPSVAGNNVPEIPVFLLSLEPWRD